MGILSTIKAKINKLNPWQEWHEFGAAWLNMQPGVLFAEPRNLSKEMKSESSSVYITLEKLRQLNLKNPLLRFKKDRLSATVFWREMAKLDKALVLHDNVEKLIETRNSYMSRVRFIVPAVAAIIGGLIAFKGILFLGTLLLMGVTAMQIGVAIKQRADIKYFEETVRKKLEDVNVTFIPKLTTEALITAVQDIKTSQGITEQEIHPLYTAVCKKEKEANIAQEANPSDPALMSIDLHDLPLTPGQYRMLNKYRGDAMGAAIDTKEEEKQPKSMTTQFEQRVNQSQESLPPLSGLSSVANEANNSPTLRNA